MACRRLCFTNTAAGPSLNSGGAPGPNAVAKDVVTQFGDDHRNSSLSANSPRDTRSASRRSDNERVVLQHPALRTGSSFLARTGEHFATEVENNNPVILSATPPMAGPATQTSSRYSSDFLTDSALRGNSKPSNGSTGSSHYALSNAAPRSVGVKPLPGHRSIDLTQEDVVGATKQRDRPNLASTRSRSSDSSASNSPSRYATLNSNHIGTARVARTTMQSAKDEILLHTSV